LSSNCCIHHMKSSYIHIYINRYRCADFQVSENEIIKTTNLHMEKKRIAKFCQIDQESKKFKRKKQNLIIFGLLSKFFNFLKNQNITQFIINDFQTAFLCDFSNKS